MRTISILLILIALAVFYPKISLANSTKNTNTKYELKIKNNIVYFLNIPIDYNATQKKEVLKSKRDLQIIRRWRKKQIQKWNTLTVGKKFIINTSAYTAAADECGNNKGITASGVIVKENRTLACPPSFPFGAKIQIDGYGTYTCEDRGGAIKNNKFDIYMKTKQAAFAFGRRNLTAQVVN